MLSEPYLPVHMTLSIHHNEHKVYHESILDYLDNDRLDWVSDEERALAIELDSVWEVQWYPSNSVGFYTLAASSLEALLRGLGAANPGLGG